MTFSIQELLSLNSKKLKLNSSLKFMRHEGKLYAYLNKYIPKISFMEISEGLFLLLNQFDGTKTTNEIIVNNKLDSDFFNLISILKRNYVLHESDLPQRFSNRNTHTLIFYPTNRCNLRCIYCYASAGETPSKQLDPETANVWIEYIFSQLTEDIKEIVVLFHGGGEPTTASGVMKEIWEEVKRKCNEKGLKYQLNSITNGNFNSDVLKWFIEEKATVVFSLDGTKEYNDMLRPRADGSGSFDEAYRNIKELIKNGISCSIRGTVGRINKDNLKEYIDLAAELGIKSLNLDKLNPFGRSDDLEGETLSDEEYKYLFLDTWKYSINKEIPIIGYSTMSLRSSKPFFCNDYENTSFALTPEGFLSPCPEVSMESDPVSGTFLVGKVNNSGKIEFEKERIKKLKERTPENLIECRECFLEYLCRGGCSVKSVRNNGDLMKIETGKCNYIREISFLLLNYFLTEPEMISGRMKLEKFDYISPDNPEISLNFVSFIPRR